MRGINWNLEDDLNTITITFPSDPPVAIVADAAQTDSLLNNLGEFRAAMMPPIPPTYTTGQVVKVVVDPAWATEHDVIQGNPILHIRDPKFGWLSYMIPKHEAIKLGKSLIGLANTPPPAPEKSDHH